jgi:hypothetical protein
MQMIFVSESYQTYISMGLREISWQMLEGGSVSESDGDIRGVLIYTVHCTVLCACHVLITFHINLQPLNYKYKYDIPYTSMRRHAPLPFSVLPRKSFVTISQ